MSWELKKILQKRLDAEEGAIVRDWGGRASVALVYPNTYAVGMGNLAVHSLYRMLGDRGNIVCERAFLPDQRDIAEFLRTDTPVMSIESQRPLAEFDVVAFSISFENDFLHLLPILSLSKIPHCAAERSGGDPLLIAGGAAPTGNPRPISKIFDAIILGEAEGFAGDLFPLLAKRLPKAEALAAMAEIPGIFVPALRPSPEGLGRRWVADLDPWPTQTVIHSAEAEFGTMHLVELQRGCPFRCKFCATPELYHPPRQRSLAAAMRMVDEGLPHRKKFGLIGAHLLTHPQFVEITRAIHARGAMFSPSSVRADDLGEEKVKLLAASGHRSLSLGIEAGSEKLRGAAGKGLSDDRILEATALLAQEGITNLRLYFMIGLPGETEGDIAAIAELALKIRDALHSHAPKAARRTSVAITLSPFVPKPGTPFAHKPFAGEAALKEKIRQLKMALAGASGVTLSFDAPLGATIEAYLSQADDGAIAFLEEAHRSGSVRKAFAARIDAHPARW